MVARRNSRIPGSNQLLLKICVAEEEPVAGCTADLGPLGDLAPFTADQLNVGGELLVDRGGMLIEGPDALTDHAEL